MSRDAPGLRLRLYRMRESLRESLRAMRSTPHPDPIFVLGTQKSGTSAIAGLLGIATRLPATIDLRRDLAAPLAPSVARGERSFGQFVRHHAEGLANPIVKDPNLTFLLPHLLERWPKARIVFVRRDPAQTVRSVLDRLGIRGDLDSLEPEALESVPPGWASVLDSRWCERWAPGGEPERPPLHYVEELARRCLLADRVCKHALATRPDRTIEVRYESFREEKASSIESLAARLALPIVDREALVAAVDRPFQPAGRAAAMTPEAFFGTNLARLRAAASLDASERSP
ncbi:MAG: sulfotransferase [Phycisphaerales bacterium]